MRKLFILVAIVFVLVSAGAATVVATALTSDAAMALAAVKSTCPASTEERRYKRRLTLRRGECTAKCRNASGHRCQNHTVGACHEVA
jgi:hypothetical protein